jgi:uncharacterized protein (TIGR03435 family)
MRTLVVCSILLCCYSASGQSQVSTAFEVASIKQSVFPNDYYFEGYISGGGVCQGGIAIAGNRVTVSKATVCGLIRIAYDMQPYQISGIPDWIKRGDRSIYYDIEARAGDEGNLRDRAREMLRTLLADRFQLRLHRETRELPVYALVVGKNRPKLTLGPQSVCGKDPNAALIGGNTGQMAICKPQDLTFFAQMLTRQVDRPVVDRTGLGGQYAFELDWTPEGRPIQLDSPPSLFTAIQEQLGLKLDPQKASVEVLVIDKAERPSAD